MSRKKSLYDIKICKNIKKIREKTGLNGTIFGEKIGISQSYLSEIENLKSKPNKTLLLAISYVYNISMEWILTGKGEMTRQGAECDTFIYKEGMPLDDDPIIAQLLEGAKKVLKSGNPVAFEALERNIRYFVHAVETEKRLKNIETRLKYLENKDKKENGSAAVGE